MKTIRILLNIVIPLVILGFNDPASAASQGPLTFVGPVSCAFSEDQTTNTTCVMGDSDIRDWKEAGNNLEHLGDTAQVFYSDACYTDIYWYWNALTQAWLQHIGGPWWTCEGTGDPIVLDMDGDGFNFTDVNTAPVSFDIDADGEQELLAWTSANDDDAFLILDVNRNNRVDDGGELFGNRTILSGGEFAANGYEALKELDLPEFGGNGDGIISRNDALFRQLQVWTDRNSNGISERRELKSFRSRGILSIDLTYYYSDIIDKHENALRFQGDAVIRSRGSSRIVETTDVYFQLDE